MRLTEEDASELRVLLSCEAVQSATRMSLNYVYQKTTSTVKITVPPRASRMPLSLAAHKTQRTFWGLSRFRALFGAGPNGPWCVKRTVQDRAGVENSSGRSDPWDLTVVREMVPKAYGKWLKLLHQPRHGRPSTRTRSRVLRLTPTPATRSEPTQHQQTKTFQYAVHSTQ